MDCPLDYSLCCQTVTLYRPEADRVNRQVVENAFYSYTSAVTETDTGPRHNRSFTLILPGDVDLQIGDRVYDGIGPEITQKAWTGFLPVHISGLSQVEYVTPCTFFGQLCHVEAGCK